MTLVTMCLNWNVIPILMFVFMSNLKNISGPLCGCIRPMSLIIFFAAVQIR